MRLLLSVASSADAVPVDVAIECPEDATVGDLARRLDQQVRRPRAPVIRTAGRHLGVVSTGILEEPDPSSEVTPLWLNGHQLDPAQRVADSPLRNGALVGIGVCLPDLFAEPTGVVEVRRVSGVGAGQVDRLLPGVYLFGAGRSCDISVDDPRVPEVAGQLEVAVTGEVSIIPDPAIAGLTVPAPDRTRRLTGPIVIPKHEAPKTTGRRSRRHKHVIAELARLKSPHLTIDPDADRPLIHLDRVALAGRQPWDPGSVLVVGDVMLELREPAKPDASLSPSPGGVTLDYNRPPRLLPPTRQTEFRLPSEPRKPDKPPIPFAMALAPMAMGATMYVITQSPYSLLIMLLSPVMMLANYTSSNRFRKRKYADEMRSYVERVRRTEESAYAALVDERAARRSDQPDPAALLLYATGPRARLWERRRTDPDWLLARVGTADVPSEVTLSDPSDDRQDGAIAWTAPDVPVGIPLEQVGVTGVAGPAPARRQLACWVIAQAACLHSPADLEIVVLSDPEGDETLNWVRWLPHVRRGEDSGVLAGVGADDDTTGRRVAELLSIVEARKAVIGESGSGGFGGARASHGFPPILVILDGARRIRLMPGLISLLRDGPQVGVIFLCLDADERQLPEECHAVVSMDTARGMVVSMTGADPVETVRPDLVSRQWCERLGRAVAPIKDVSSEDLSSALPSSSRLLDVLKLDPPTPEAIAQRWMGGGRTTKAVLGEGMDGVFTIDIRSDGPHGLVAGTTGSGKSELLQTLIASLAVGNRPDEMTFVLVDYKGGAAFKDCNRLPHTVGMVTDLDGHLTTRALESLGAELRRREHQLADADAKDIEDYLAARQPGDDPMPRLMIVIDEFAALVAELPDFVSGLVDIARRGRSLGVHLILATQRPAGVVSAEIKSNTNLRIALRVTDRNDSQDVIESGEAAEIAKSTPGRGYARLGHSSLVPFQSSRVGGRPGAGGGGAAVALRELTWHNIGRDAPAGPAGEDEEDISIPTDLSSLVEAVTGATQHTGVSAPSSPWLPPLADVVTLDDVLSFSDADPVSPHRVGLPFGMVDIPSEQRRAVASYDLSGSGHLAVVGAARTGRSTVLRALAGVVGREVSPRDVHLYGVDCGNNALLPLVSLPHTGAVVTRDQADRLARLSARLRSEIGRRQQLLAEQGYADLSEQRAHAEPEQRLPYLLVLFDRWEGFVAAFESYDGGVLVDQWMQILQEGPGVGVKVVLTADRSALVGRLSTLVDSKLLLRMTDPSDFGGIGMSPRDVPTHMPPGRGFHSEGLREVQVALLTDDDAGTAQVAALQEIGREASERHTGLSREHRPFRVDPLPARITLAEAQRLAEQPLAATDVPVAVGGDTLTLRTLDAVEHGPGMLVVGPRRSGRSTALATIAASTLSRGWRLGVITPRRSPLQELAGASGVEAVLTLESDKDQVNDVLESLVPTRDGPPTALLVDDLELLGVDGWLADGVTAHLGKLRDSGSVIVAAGTTDDLGSSYRGPASALKKSRSGLLLSPGSPNDGDLFSVRLPRSVTGGGTAGRGLLVAAGQWQLVQVAEPGEGIEGTR